MDDIDLILSQLSFSKILFSCIVLIVAWGIIRGLEWLLNTLGSRFTRYRLQITRIFPVLRLGIWMLAVMEILLGIMQLREGTLIAVIATIGVAIGLAAQDFLRSFIAGIIVLFTRPFGLGDMVRLGDDYGEVVGMDMVSVRLRTFSDDIVTIPNADFFRQAVANSNAGELTEMIAIPLDLPASVPVAEVMQLGHQAAIQSPYTYLKKPVMVSVEDVAGTFPMTRFTIKAYVVDVRLERVMATDIMVRMKSALIDRRLLKDASQTFADAPVVLAAGSAVKDS